MLIAVAIALFVIDVFAPTHGVLSAGGVVAFFLGALMLFDRSDPFLRLSLVWIIPATVTTALFFVVLVGAGLRAQRLPVQVGVETLRGKVVRATTRIDARGGKVFVEGEYWNAVSPRPVEQGDAGRNGVRVPVVLPIPRLRGGGLAESRFEEPEERRPVAGSGDAIDDRDARGKSSNGFTIGRVKAE